MRRGEVKRVSMAAEKYARGKGLLPPAGYLDLRKKQITISSQNFILMRNRSQTYHVNAAAGAVVLD
jgi:hypothetical protein